LVGAALVTAGLWLSHMPSLLLHAQFYADDRTWYAGAYTYGPILSLAHPAHGYVVLLQRLTASLSLALPMVAAPTFFNAVALLVEVAGIAYLLSPRMASAIPALWARLAIAALVVALPNAYDTSGNLTNSQWHLGLIAFLVVFARPPRGRWGRLSDGLILTLSGLTGPYCIILEPIVVWRWRQDRQDAHRQMVMLVVSVCTAIQILMILVTGGVHPGTRDLGAGLLPLITMLGRQWTLGLLVGARGLTGLVGTPVGSNPAVLALLAAVPVATCLWAGWRGPAILRAFCLLAALELILALAQPTVSTPPAWPNLGRPADIVNFSPGGIRYFLYPLLAFAISLGWLAWRQASALLVHRGPRPRGLRRAGVATGRAAGLGAAALLLIAAADGVPRDWLYPPYLEEHWAAEVDRFQSAPAGTKVVIPVNPTGWTMVLVAR
ncbi:MAG: hypothetical protein WCB85_12175, partial [Candidatus Dormiibacterota bacterium]